jgi:hypothetical protein
MPDLLFIAEEHARKFGFKADVPLSDEGREPDARPTSRIAAQRELKALYSDFPVGTAEYKTPEVQAEVRRLTQIVVGSAPIVGAGGRTA